MLGRTSTAKFPSTGARAKRRIPTAKSESPVGYDAEPNDELVGETERDSPPDQGRRQVGEADLERAVAEHQLEVEGGEEEGGEHAGGHEDADDVGGSDVTQAEEAKRHPTQPV
jgi:hypothetical protein